ncbi:type VII secretion-associated protein, Rv3446c family [Chlamydia abortus]|nr:type VII secretion-associated protein, Rv3446c family [Chlamydia abortus]
MRKWIAVCLITAVITASISACSFPGSKEKEAGENRAALTAEHEQQEQGQEEKDNNHTENEAAEPGMTKVFSNKMSLKLPQGLEVQSNETSNAKLVYTDSHNKVKLEMKHDPEQMMSDAGIDGARLKMRAVMEQDSEGEKLEWLKDETQLVHGKHIAINEVIIPSKKGEGTYHFVAWAELDGALLEIDFTAPANEKDDWQKAVQEMIESIQM